MKTHIIPQAFADTPIMRDVTLKVDAANGINLGQGLCKLPTPELLKEAAHQAVRDNRNLYSPANGIVELREAISDKLKSYNDVSYTPDEIVVTPGSIGACEAVCQTFLTAGDEVINFRPYYPYHHNAFRRRCAEVKYVDLHAPDWKYDIEQLKASITDRTKLLLITTPNNPTGKIFTRDEMEQIAALCIEHDLLCVTDEVYEYMVYDDNQHLSMASIPGMFERTVTMSSYSKTFAITGWRVGYLAAPAKLASVLKSVVDQVFVCAPTPLQFAVATGVRELGPEYYSWLNSEYARKRDLMRVALERGGIAPYVPQGAYYMLGSIADRFPGKSSEEVSDIMIERAKVGAVPASDFVGSHIKGDPDKSTFFRFCFAIDDQLIEQAGEQLAAL